MICQKLIRFTFFSLIFFAGIVLPSFGHEYIEGGRADTLHPLKKLNRQALVVAHIVVDRNNVVVVDTATVRLLFAHLNKVFRPIGLSFSVCELRYVDNFNFEVLDRGKDDFQNMLVTYEIPNRINVFFTREIKGFPGPVCGYTQVNVNGSSGIFIACPEGGSVTHEFGHFFGLEDTFRGNGAELADGSNCHFEGDGICDTPADPFKEGDDVAGYVNSNCAFIYPGKDAKGKYYAPEVSNPMSFYGNCRCQNFSHGQYERIIDIYLKKPVSW